MINKTTIIKKNVIEKLKGKKDLNNKIVKRTVKKEILENTKGQLIPNETRKDILNDLLNDLIGYGIVQNLLDDNDVTEIMINGYDKIFYEKNGKILKSKLKYKNNRDLMNFIQKVVSKINRKVNRSNPIVDARLNNGERVNIILPPVSIEGPVVTIRKFKEGIDSFKELINYGTINKEIRDFLNRLIKSKYNLFISGGTSTGKTTLLNVLCNYIPEDQRVITIEDSAEINIKNLNNLIRLETRNENIQGENKIEISALIKNALRMRPDRIIIGEIRGKEAYDMLNAMNTGHDGAISTGHGNSIKDMFRRMEMMVLMGKDYPIKTIRRQICSAIDIMIFVKKVTESRRVITKISEIIGYKDGDILINDLFVYEGIHKNSWIKKGKLKNRKKLEVYENSKK